MNGKLTHLNEQLILRIERAQVGLGLGHLQRRGFVLGRVLLVGQRRRLVKVSRRDGCDGVSVMRKYIAARCMGKIKNKKEKHSNMHDNWAIVSG